MDVLVFFSQWKSLRTREMVFRNEKYNWNIEFFDGEAEDLYSGYKCSFAFLQKSLWAELDPLDWMSVLKQMCVWSDAGFTGKKRQNWEGLGLSC